MIREGASVRKLRLSEPSPSARTSTSSTIRVAIAIARQREQQHPEADLEQPRVAPRGELGPDRAGDRVLWRRRHYSYTSRYFRTKRIATMFISRVSTNSVSPQAKIDS